MRTLCLTAALAVIAASRIDAATPPHAGDAARNFALRTLDGRRVELESELKLGPVVLVVLRGWPGYQCPLCTRQVQDFILHAGEFAARGARVIFIYPGPADSLRKHAGDFMDQKQWPGEFTLLPDPDYVFTQRYGLRWDARNETAYPATFVVDEGGRVRLAHVSRSHGDRARAGAALEALHAIKK